MASTLDREHQLALERAEDDELLVVVDEAGFDEARSDERVVRFISHADEYVRSLERTGRNLV